MSDQRLVYHSVHVSVHLRSFRRKAAANPIGEQEREGLDDM